MNSDIPDGSIAFVVPSGVVGHVEISEDDGTVTYIYNK